MHYIVKLFPEITIKSAPVRKRFTKQLRDNLRRQLKRIDAGIDVQRDWEKIDVWLTPELAHLHGEVESVLARTPGIANFSRVQSFPLSDFEDILARTREAWCRRLAGKTFCVRVKRSGQHDFQSTDVERYLGAGLMRACGPAGVRLKGADEVVRLEIRRNEYHLVEETRQGMGGFPLGSQDAALSLISGGFDSTVASYLTLRRGLTTHFCFFNLGGRAHELGVKEVSWYLWKTYASSHRVKFITVPFEEVVSEILSRVDHAYMGVVLKRMMMRAAGAVADSLDIGALVTGESIAQVSSQTLTNLGLIDEVSDRLTLRPLSVMDKGDIIDIARRIGTEDFAANMPEYCGVISVKPATRARRDRVVAEEASMDPAVLERAIAGRRVESIDQLEMEAGESDRVDLVAVPPPGAVIVDIRHPDEIEQRALRAGKAEVVAVPFFELDRAVSDFDPHRRYLLYCDRGVMSRLHAEMLREKGYANIDVYRPPA